MQCVCYVTQHVEANVWSALATAPAGDGGGADLEFAGENIVGTVLILELYDPICKGRGRCRQDVAPGGVSLDLPSSFIRRQSDRSPNQP